MTQEAKYRLYKLIRVWEGPGNRPDGDRGRNTLIRWPGPNGAAGRLGLAGQPLGAMAHPLPTGVSQGHWDIWMTPVLALTLARPYAGSL